jgi:hypothetical protein
MKMKPLVVVVLLILLAGFRAYGEEKELTEDDFRLLTPEQQIQYALHEWRYDLYSFGYYWKHEVVLQENAKAVKPVVLRYFKETEAPIQYKTDDRTFGILEYLTLSTLGYLWTPGERTEITELYRDKIDRYLRVNRIVDFTVQKLEAFMEGSNSGLWGEGAFLFLPEITGEQALLKKYTDMGYEGLSLPSPEHRVRQFLADWKYERSYNHIIHWEQRRNLIENAETVKPALLKCLEEIEVPKPYRFQSDGTFYLIQRLTTQDFRELWTLEERKEIAEIYRAKIDWYLRTYTEVNGMIQMFEEIIEGMGSEGDIVYPPAPDLETLHKKYSGMGYEGLWINRQSY